MIHNDVLLVTLQAHGHFRPFMAFGELLYRYSNGSVKSHLLYGQVDDGELPTSEFPSVSLLPIEVPEDVKNMESLIDQTKWLVSHGENMIGPSCEYANKLRPVAVIYDSFIGWGHDLGEVLGVKSFAFCSFALHAYYIFGKIGWEPEERRSTDEQRTIEGLGTVSADCLPYLTGPTPSGFLKPGSSRSVIANDSPCQPGFHILRDIVERDLLVSTPKFDKGAVHTLGYLNDLLLQSSDTVDKRDETIEWLDKQPDRSVIYIALGSWVQLDVCDLIELAEALRCLKAPFLWALRKRVGNSKASNGPPNVGGGDVAETERKRIPLQDTDDYGLPVGFVEEVKEHSLIVPWVDQRRLLTHPAIKLFVTHCGWNSLTEGISLTPVPKAFIPVAGEQGMNAEVAERFWKIGRQLWVEGSPKTLQRDVVVERINECLTDKVILDKSKKVYEDHQQHLKEHAELSVMRLLSEIQSQ